jgi:inner membrane protein
MDLFTHALLGACTAQAVFARRLPRSAWLIGAVAGAAPDLDVLIRPADDPLGGLLWHRHFTHALIMVPPQAAVIALLVLLLSRLAPRPQRPRPAPVYGAAALAMLTHGLNDALTSYGTLLFWPFSHQRVALDLLPIIDPVVTLALLAALAVAVARSWTTAARPTPRAGARRAAVIGLLVVTAYTGLAVLQRARAMHALRTLAALRGETPHYARAMPIPLSLLLWRGVYRTDADPAHALIRTDFVRTPYLGETTVRPGGAAPVLTEQRLLDDLLRSGRPADDLLLTTFRRFAWFADGFTARTPDDPDLIADLRYGLATERPTGLWGLRLTGDPRRPAVFEVLPGFPRSVLDRGWPDLIGAHPAYIPLRLLTPDDLNRPPAR